MTTVEDAVRLIRADYYSDVLSMAKDLASRMKSGEVEDFGDALHDDVDGCARVIYTYQAKLGLLASDNEDAAEEEGADATSPEARMYYALQADIRDTLDSRGVDMNDPSSWPDIDMREFE